MEEPVTTRLKRTTGGRYEVLVDGRYVGDVYKDGVNTSRWLKNGYGKYGSYEGWFWSTKPGGVKGALDEHEVTRKGAIQSLIREAQS